MSVIIDTSAWIDYFKPSRSMNGDEVERLLVTGDALVVGVVYAELLRGTRSESAFQMLAQEMESVEFEETSKLVWEQAGRILADLQRAGNVIPFTDAVIAAHALTGEHALLSSDQHFGRVPGIHLHEPRT